MGGAQRLLGVFFGSVPVVAGLVWAALFPRPRCGQGACTGSVAALVAVCGFASRRHPACLDGAFRVDFP